MHLLGIWIMMKSLRMTMTDTTRAKKLIKLLERLIKQDHLYDDEKMKELKEQLASVKEQVEEMEKQNYKGFGKK